MKVSESIKSAWAAVEESGVPEHMQELAFKEALRALLGTSETATATAPRVVPPLRSTPEVDGGDAKSGSDADDTGATPSPSEDAVIAAVSEDTGVPAEKLEKVFHIDGGVVKLIGAHSKYGSTTSDQARAIAQIVTVVRKIGMGRTDTSFDVIKDACDSKHCYDSKNFASQHMPKIDGFVVKGEKRNRRLEAKGSGVSAFPTVIDKVLGES